MGAEVTHRTKAAFLRLTNDLAEARSDESIEAEKPKQPFLGRVPAIVEASQVRADRVSRLCEEKFHCQGLHHAREAQMLLARSVSGVCPRSRSRRQGA